MLVATRPALVLLVVFTLLLGLAYPLAMTGVAQVLFPFEANGSLVVVDGKTVGSTLVGQGFADSHHFQSRPSAVSYNAAGTGGSNLGPTNRALIARIAAGAVALGATADKRVPIDLVTTSGSGIDPDISPEAALYQVDGVAKARRLDPALVRGLVERALMPRTFGIFGEPRVNVLRLNLALDAADPPKPDISQ